MTPEEEAKKIIEENQKLVKEIRDRNEETDKNMFTKAEFKEFEEKIDAQFLANKDLIEKLETESKRPGAGDTKAEEEEKAAFEKKAFFNFLRKESKAEMDPEERKALVEDTTGRILVPEDLEAEIYRELPKISVIRPLATIRQTTRDRIRKRSLTEVAVGWGKLELAGEAVESDMTPSEEFHYVEDLEGIAKIGKDELADTDVQLEALVVDSFGRAQAEAEDTAFIEGSGHSNQQPEGITNGSTVTRVETASIDAIVVNDMLKVRQAVPAQYRKNSVFIMHSSTELALMYLQASTTGAYYWQPQVALDHPATFAGKKVYTQDDLPEVADATGCDLVICGDIKAGYRIVDRTQMYVQRLIELYAGAGLIGILVSKRVTGAVIRADAIRVLAEPSA